MSNYNTQLQSNNIDLQTVLQTLQTKAAGGGINLPELTNEGIAADLLVNKELIDSNGNKITGSMPNNGSINSTMDGINTKTISIPVGYTSGGTVSLDNTIDNEVNVQTELLYQIVDTLESKAVGGDTSIEDGIIMGTINSCRNNRVTFIRSSAFTSCYSLTTASFPAVTSINQYAFANCVNLTSISFPAATYIGDYAFYSCRSLTTASFPAVTTVDDYAFVNCSNLTTANFPAATSIGWQAFSGCTNLTTANFLAVTTINNTDFSSCKNLVTVNFPAVTGIGYSAFTNCTKLTTINFPVATYIGWSAFNGCHNLPSANFPAVTKISSSAFCYCRSLSTASFPVATFIDNSAFAKCYNLKSLYLTGSSLCMLSNSEVFTSTPIGGYSKSAGTYGSIYVPASLLTSYQTATNWTYFSSRFVGI